MSRTPADDPDADTLAGDLVIASQNNNRSGEHEGSDTGNSGQPDGGFVSGLFDEKVETGEADASENRSADSLRAAAVFGTGNQPDPAGGEDKAGDLQRRAERPQ